jgi:hypothetical protein
VKARDVLIVLAESAAEILAAVDGTFICVTKP